MEKPVVYEREGVIGKISLNNPEKSNPLGLEALKALIAAFRESEQNGDVCVIYGAKGKNFTFGADLKDAYEMISNPAMKYNAVADLWSWQELSNVMLGHPGIIIVGYHGWVVGGGFEHTLCSDFRIAADDTRIMLPELDMGIFFSNASTKILPRLIGEGNAKRLMILGDQINAEEAFRIGLVTKVCKLEDLDDALMELANRIALKDPRGLRLAKKVINESEASSYEDALYREGFGMFETGSSSEAQKRIGAFIKKGK